MSMPNISGGWLSKGQLVYTIIQVNDKFVWHVIHTNGIMETGIGWFPTAEEEGMSTDVMAQWNFHGGQMNADVCQCSGKVIVDGEKVTEIRWKDLDHFQRIS